MFRWDLKKCLHRRLRGGKRIVVTLQSSSTTRSCSSHQHSHLSWDGSDGETRELLCQLCSLETVPQSKSLRLRWETHWEFIPESHNSCRRPRTVQFPHALSHFSPILIPDLNTAIPRITWSFPAGHNASCSPLIRPPLRECTCVRISAAYRHIQPLRGNQTSSTANQSVGFNIEKEKGEKGGEKLGEIFHFFWNSPQYNS